MKNAILKGWRTMLVSLIVAILPSALTYLCGVDWTKLGISPAAGAIIGVVFAGLRMATDTALGKKVAIVVGVLLLGVTLSGPRPATAREPEQLIGPLHWPPNATPVPAPAAGSDPLQSLSEFFSKGVDDAINLSTSIPSLQDGNGQSCARAAKSFVSVIAAHPDPISGHAAADLEAIRLKLMAAHQFCESNACRQVFAEADNAIATFGAPVSVPAFATICARIPTIEVVAPTPDPNPAPASVPTTEPTKP